MIRAQSSTEYLLVLGIVLVILVPFIYYGYISSQESIRLLQARRAVESLATAADYVYTQGYGSRVTVKLMIPEGIDFNNSYIGKPASSASEIPSEEINLRLYTQKGFTDVFKQTQEEVRGNWLNRSGPYFFTVYMAEDGYVLIVPYELEFLINQTYFTYNIQTGHTQNFAFNITSLINYTNQINFTKTGDISTWVNLSLDSINLTSLNSQEITGIITVPTGATLGLHTGKITAESANSSIDIFLNIIVYSGNQGCNSSYAIINFYHNSSYNTYDEAFEKEDTVIINTTGWNPNSNITIDLQNSTNNSQTGYPKIATTNSNGNYIFTWSPVQKTPDNYTAYFNDSTIKINKTFEVKACN